MGFDAAATAIRSRFNTEVAVPLGLLVLWDNAPPPPTPDDSTWVAFEILWGESLKTQTGGSLQEYRTPGIAYARIHVPAKAGTGDAEELADSIATSFRSVSDSGVRFSTPFLDRVGLVEDKWWSINVLLPFEYDEVT